MVAMGAGAYVCGEETALMSREGSAASREPDAIPVVSAFSTGRRWSTT